MPENVVPSIINLTAERLAYREHITGGVREREQENCKETERQRDRETDRQTDRQRQGG